MSKRQDPFANARDNKPAVVTFLSEISTGKPEKFRVVPARYLCHLYNLWSDRRGFSEEAHMVPQRFSYVMSRLGYRKTRKTQAGIVAFNVELLPRPNQPDPEACRSILAADLARFEYPSQAETPPSILNEIIAIRHIAELMERNRVEESDRWTEEERTTSAHTILNSTFNNPQTSETQVDAGKPDFEQAEANDAQADAGSSTETNDYDA